MPTLFGKQITKAEICRLVGDLSQIAGASRFTYGEGKAKGAEAIEVKTGSGLRFVILLDKGMNIAYAEYQGIPVSFISKTGVVSSVHYDEPDFLRSFEGGLLTTCGMTYMGSPCIDEGVELGAHGRVSNIPAYDVSIKQEWQENGEYLISVSGKVRESSMFGENMVLKRTIKTYLGSSDFSIHDEVCNEGFSKTPIMMLYHMNFGYPLLSEDSVLKTNCENLRPRDESAEVGMLETTSFSKPIPSYAEQVFYRDAVDNSYAELYNPALGLSCKIGFSSKQLPLLVEWKQVGEQDYVLGLEPATNPPEGRAKMREQGTLQFLQPQESRSFDITVSIFKK